MPVKKSYHRFILFSGFGLLLFIVRLPNTNTTLLMTMIKAVQNLFSDHYSLIALLFMTIVCILTFWVKLFNPKCLDDYPFIKKNFNVNSLQIFFRLSALLIIISYRYVSFSHVAVLNAASAEIIDITGSTIIFISMATLFLPFLSDYGLAELLEVLFDRFLKPLFKVPGHGMVNIVTSFFIGSTMSMYLTGVQYEDGRFSRQDAMRIMTTLTIPSLSTSLLYWSVIGDSAYFFDFYLLTFCVFISMALLLVRIPPFTKMSSVHSKPVTPSKIDGHRLRLGLERAAEKAAVTRYSIKKGCLSLLSILLSFVPFLVALGTLSIILIEHTRILEYASMPYGAYLNIFGFEQPYLLSQTFILYTIDLIMPAVILRSIPSVQTQIMMGAITMNQLLYIASFLIILSFHQIATKKELLLILLQRVLMSVPLTVFWSWLLFH